MGIGVMRGSKCSTTVIGFLTCAAMIGCEQRGDLDMRCNPDGSCRAPLVCVAPEPQPPGAKWYDEHWLVHRCVLPKEVK